MRHEKLSITELILGSSITNERGDIIFIRGMSVPIVGSMGYATGGLFISEIDGQMYFNRGTANLANFQEIAPSMQVETGFFSL